jgi:hypothetical protein
MRMAKRSTSSTGLQARLSRPLDFLVVADHSDDMWFFPRLYAGDPAFLADETVRRPRWATADSGSLATIL